MSTSKPVVVYVEDDPLDLMLVQRFLDRSPGDVQVRHFEDGDVALEAFRKRDPNAPFFLTVDINMPRLSGFELLEAMRDEALLGGCEVVVLSTSSSAADRARAADLGARDYLCKGDDDAMPRLLQLILEFDAAHAN